MEHKYKNYWDDPLIWYCLALIMDPRHKLINCIVILDEIYTNLNKLEKLEEFVNKVKENLYNLFEEFVS